MYRLVLRAGALLAGPALLALLSCSSSEYTLGAGGRSGMAAGTSAVAGTMTTGGGGSGAGGGVGLGGLTSGGSGGVPACATTSAVATISTEPIDIIIVLDNSGSMAEEMEAAEANINVNFAGILDGAAIDYRVILLSRHRYEDRTASEEASTSICVSKPLSGLDSCPAPLPIFSERFYQYSQKIESFDALNWVLDGYTTAPIDDDYAMLAPDGWAPFLRDGVKKAFVLMTDDDESNDDDPTTLLTVDDFMSQLSALSPTNFGTIDEPTYSFHSIIGLKEKDDPTAAYLPDEPEVTEICTTNGAVIESPGPTYQQLSIRTGGLRFPLCQFPGYDAVFQAIAADVIVKTNIACDFDIPPPPVDQEIDLDKVAISKKQIDGTPLTPYGQVIDPVDCQPDAFYIDRTENRIFLCPEACDALQAEPEGGVDVLFTCESTIIVK